MTKVGVISDTHGLMRPQALVALRGCARVLHAGDIGSAAILEQLAQIAPVTAIRGNNDTHAWAKTLPDTADLTIEGVRVHIVHDVKDLEPSAAIRATVVISGHSHRPSVERRDQVLFLNPGSAGPRRFKLPIAIAILTISGARSRARIVELEV